MQSVNQRKQTGRHDPFRRMPSAAFVAFAAFAFSLLVTASAFSQEIPAGEERNFASGPLHQGDHAGPSAGIPDWSPIRI